MLDKIKDIEEMGNKLLSSNRLSSIYEDKFSINNVDFKFKETFTLMLQENNIITLFNKIESENLYSALIEQLNKDFRMSNLDESFSIRRISRTNTIKSNIIC
jgi:hypothetical protein